MLSTTISSLSRDLERDEDRKSNPYRDSRGFLTIGVGHNLDAEGLCDAAIDAQLAYDLQEKVVKPLARYLPWHSLHSENIQRALGNLCFNLGIGGLLEFRETLSLIEHRHYPEAAAHLLTNSRYHSQIKSRLDRIAELIRQG